MSRLILVVAVLAVLLGATLLWLSGTGAPPEGASAPDGAAATSISQGGVVPDGTDDGPDNSFIVCPGHPRCP